MAPPSVRGRGRLKPRFQRSHKRRCGTNRPPNGRAARTATGAAPPPQERPRTTQPGRQLRLRGARSRQSAWGSQSQGLTPGPDPEPPLALSPPRSFAPSLSRPSQRATWAARTLPAGATAAECSRPRPRRYKGGGVRGRDRGVPGHAPPPSRHVLLAGPPDPCSPSRALRAGPCAAARTAPARTATARTATGRTAPARTAPARTATALRASGGGGTGFGAECAGRPARMTARSSGSAGLP
ncbi:uncharacterized protein C10orf95-like [Serinus canaria]|uniref:uncharacterized protein C10orf95-like n=1 Tax=Serinus canaria TaxID=9135 RepID=UPI0021CD14BF|nr:uncharacterized protein C10orf95-like [Serinus canaria]